MAMYPYVALRGPTYRENSHANHTWHPPSHKTACFQGSGLPSPWVRFPSPAPSSRHCWPIPANDLQLAMPSNKLADVSWRWLWFHTQSCPYDRVRPLVPTANLRCRRVHLAPSPPGRSRRYQCKPMSQTPRISDAKYLLKGST